MSHIDSYNHEYIGAFGYLPIYHPLQEISKEKWGDPDYGANPSNLVLGGGSGEHPGLVLHHLTCFVITFLEAELNDKQAAQISEEDKSYLNELSDQDKDEMLEFCGWRVDEYARFYEFAQKEISGERLKEEEFLEDWLICSIGEFVFFSMPELVSDYDKISSIFEPFDIQPRYYNVTLDPSGYPSRGGRKIEDGELTWGVHRFQFK